MLGDFRPGDIIDLHFTTRNGGVPTTLLGTPAVSIYKANSTTESTAGLTLDVDFDSRTGLNHLRIDTGADGTFYATGADFDAVLTAGTVGGVSVVGVHIDGFSIGHRAIARATLVDTVTTLTNAPSDSSGVTTLMSRLSALRAGYLDNLSAGAAALETSLQGLITTVGIAGAGLTAAATSVWAVATRLLTAGTNIVLAKGTGVTGFNDVSTAQVTTAATAATPVAASVTGSVGSVVGLTASNLDATVSSRLATSGYTAPDNASIAAIKAKTDNFPEGIKKNSALNNFEFFMADSSDHVTAKTGLTITATRSIDGAAFGACANAAVEVSSGIYKINLAAADLNGDLVTFRFTATGADDALLEVKTSP